MAEDVKAEVTQVKTDLTELRQVRASASSSLLVDLPW